MPLSYKQIHVTFEGVTEEGEVVQLEHIIRPLDQMIAAEDVFKTKLSEMADTFLEGPQE